MSQNKEQLKARLKEQLSKEIDELVESYNAESRPTLSDIETMALTLSAKMSQATTQTLVETNEQHRRAEQIMCPDCGQKARHKGTKSRYIATRSGEVQVERIYYYCEACRKGFFPPR
jgi:phage terminase large subunit GpA-like protein